MPPLHRKISEYSVMTLRSSEKNKLTLGPGDGIQMVELLFILPVLNLVQGVVPKNP